MLGDHFWPAMYPGIIVGLLVGLAGGNVMSTVLGAAGGLLGAMVFHFASGLIGLEEDIVALAVLIGGAVLGAFLLTQAGKRIRGAG